MAEQGHANLKLPHQVLTFFLFAALATLFLAPVLLGDRALLPTGFLMQMSPWAQERGAAAAGRPAPPWNPILWDAIAQFYPWRAFAAHWMRQGIIPLWDPHQFCGTPFLANSQSAVLYPLHLLLLDLPAGLPVARAMALLAAIHLTLAGWLTCLWLRAQRLSQFAAVLGGVAFMLSGFVVTWLELPSFLAVACWLPLLFLTVHRVHTAPSLPRAAGVAVAVGLILLGGHLQVAFYCLLAAGLYGVCRLSSRTPGYLLLGLLLGIMLAAPQLLPAIELSHQSHRAAPASAAGYRAYAGGAMPAAQLVRLFLPDFYGNPTRGDYAAGSPADYTEYAAYLGGVGLWLALAGLLAWRRRPRETLFPAGLAGLALLMALGTPIDALFYFGIPGFSQSGSPARVLVLFCFAGAWLAALGAQALIEDEGTRGLPLRALVLWCLLLGAALAPAWTFVRSLGGDFGELLSRASPDLTRALLFVLLAAGLPVGLRRLGKGGSVSPKLASVLGSGVLAALLVGELWRFGAGFNPTGPLSEVYPPTPLFTALRSGPASGLGRVLPVNRRWSLSANPHALLPPNSALALGLLDPQGYDSLFIGRYKGFSNLVQGEDSAPPENGNMLLLSHLASPLLPLLAADRVVLNENGPGTPQRDIAPSPPMLNWPLLYAHAGLEIRRDPSALPRAFIAASWREAPDAAAATELQHLAAVGALGKTCIVAPSATAVEAPGVRAQPATGRTAPVQLQEMGPNDLTITLPGRRSGMLVLLDNAYPGWRATELPSYRPLALRRVDLTFRGVPIAPGTRSIRMTYEPASFRLGLYLAVLAVGLLLALSVGMRLMR